ncbi:MAG: hypothetical protein KAJ18_08605 [Candidatus Omnitrophica bacterium]|nr:hypothetical protein [Candidatus Omnitrophota bacterium]
MIIALFVLWAFLGVNVVLFLPFPKNRNELIRWVVVGGPIILIMVIFSFILSLLEKSKKS